MIAFEGPGQGAVLDAFGLEDVALVGICLAICAAAREPRIRRVVAFDVLSDFFDCLVRQSGPAAPLGVRSSSHAHIPHSIVGLS